MTVGQIAKNYYVNEHLNCAVSVLLAANDVYGMGLKKEDARLITAFGGGIGCGNLCGALAGAQAALGVALLPEGELYTPEFKDVCSGFVTEFEALWGTTLCTPIKEKNATPDERCGKTVLETGDALQKYIDKLKK